VKKLLIAFVLLIQSTLAFSIIVEDVKEISFVEASCPICAEETEVNYTTITFGHTSCSRFADESFSLDIKERPVGFGADTETFVSIKLAPVKDCKGPTQSRQYSISTKELKKGKRYILTNSSVL
jgi:hypothetical protein